MSVDPRQVFVTSNVHEANLVCGLLEANGVDPFIYGQNISSLNPFLTNAVGGVRVFVPADQWDLACSVLVEFRKESPYTGDLSPFVALLKDQAVIEDDEDLNASVDEISMNGAPETDDVDEVLSNEPSALSDPLLTDLKCPGCRAVAQAGSNFCDQCGDPLNR